MRQDILAKIRKHWTTYLPGKVAELKAEGMLEESMQGAAKLAQAEIDHLRSQGYQEHEAEEVALKEFVYLQPEEGADEEDWEREERSEMERNYLENVAPYLIAPGSDPPE